MANGKILQFEPSSELLFRAPFTEPSPSGIKLTNPGDRVVVFKVKTTAPKKYSVRPTHGVVMPHSTATIQIILIPSDVESLLVAQRRHKFMVQATYGPDNANNNFDAETFWRYFNNSGANRSYEQRFRCAFDFQFGSQQTVPPSAAAIAAQAQQEQSSDLTRMTTPMASTISSSGPFLSVDQSASNKAGTAGFTQMNLGPNQQPNMTTPMSNAVQQRPLAGNAMAAAGGGQVRALGSPLDATSPAGATGSHRSASSETSNSTTSTAISQPQPSSTGRKLLILLLNILLVVALLVGLYMGRGSIQNLHFRY